MTFDQWLSLKNINEAKEPPIGSLKKLLSAIDADLKGEAKAITDYTHRIQYCKSIGKRDVASVLTEILNDEKDHHQKIQKLISDLHTAEYRVP